MAPAGCPPEVINKLSQEIAKAIVAPEIKAYFANLGIELIGNSPEQFAQEIRDDTSRWAKVAQAANIKADN